MYDVTSEESFLNLRNWITSIRDTSLNSNLKIAIIGNKLDLVNNENSSQVVQSKHAEALAKVIFILLLKSNYGSNEIFAYFAFSRKMMHFSLK